MADDGYQIIRTAAISQITVVRYYPETVQHIVEEHPEFAGELPSVMQAISDTVANPTMVYRSNTAASTSFVFCSSQNTFGDLSMYVPVKVVTGTSGVLKTAYFSGSVRGELIWEASNEN